MSTHFSPDALKFLRGLKRHNDRDWFNERKSLFERELKTPMLALIAEINDALLTIAPLHVRPPNKILMRIYRDTRFSPDKRPYKTNAAAWWAREGLQKISGAGFYFELSPTHITVAAGVYMPEREQLLATRRHLAEHHTEFRSLAKSRKLRSLLVPEWETAAGLPLSRPPKGFSKEDPALNLIRCRQWALTAKIPAEEALSPNLANLILDRFRVAAPLVSFFNQALLPRRSQPLF